TLNGAAAVVGGGGPLPNGVVPAAVGPPAVIENPNQLAFNVDEDVP
ncbi:hypothetical protein L195_g064543, partial [Trifolium pratense]